MGEVGWTDVGGGLMVVDGYVCGRLVVVRTGCDGLVVRSWWQWWWTGGGDGLALVVDWR